MHRSAFRHPLIIFILLVMVFGSAYAVVLVKHYGREEVMRAHELRDQHDTLKIEWQDLQRRKSELTALARIQSIAEQHGMRVPTPQQTRMIMIDETDL